jgi:phosphoglycerate dehydrogenase-like enzyme
VTIHVALLNDYQQIAMKMAPWEQLGPDVHVQAFTVKFADENEAAAKLAEFDIVMAMRERQPFPRSLLERLPRLKMISSAGRRNAAIDLPACTELGILVCGTTSSSRPTAEFTWAAILALLRHIPDEVHATRAGKWQVSLGTELDGKTLGLMGLGRIGAMVAEVALAFKMRLLAWSPHLTPERASACGATLVSCERLLRDSDIVTIHLGLGPGTRGLVGAQELAWMRPSAYLVNTSRGPIVDEPALIDALRRKAIAGAAVDVFEPEPIARNHPLLALDNALVTPHLGGHTWEHRAEYYVGTLKNIQAYLANAPEGVMNPDVLPKRRKG